MDSRFILHHTHIIVLPLYDISGNEHNGTFNNNITLSSTRKYGQGISFDGTDENIDLIASIKRYLNFLLFLFGQKKFNTSDNNNVFKNKVVTIT